MSPLYRKQRFQKLNDLLKITGSNYSQILNLGWLNSKVTASQAIGDENKYSPQKECVHAQSLQSCLTLCNPMDCSPPGFSVHGILQAMTLDWVAVLSSRGSDPEIEPKCPELQVDSLLTAEPLGNSPCPAPQLKGKAHTLELNSQLCL